jgi:hypothetical protein
VKLTAPYRVTLSEMPYPDVDAAARVLVEQAADRLLWGSDWPHTFIKTCMPNDGDLFDLFARWVPDEKMRTHILVTNPQKLYDFPAMRTAQPSCASRDPNPRHAPCAPAGATDNAFLLVPKSTSSPEDRFRLLTHPSPTRSCITPAPHAPCS